MKSESKRPIAAWAASVGLLLVAAGFLWPLVGNAHWPEEKAEEFAESSAAFHHAAHAHDSEADFATIRQRFDKIKAELQTARQRPAEIAFWLKAIGCTMAAIGLVMLLAEQNPK